MKEFIQSHSETCPPIETDIPNTSVYIPVSQFGGELRPIINRAVKFARITSQAIGEEYLKGLERHCVPSWCEDLEKDGMHLPSFRLYDSENAQPILEQSDYPEESIDSRGLLLVFRLPGFTEQAWHRAIESGQTPTEMAESVEYKLGRNSAAIFRSQTKDSERSKRLSFRRINSLKDHEPDKFYYLHEIKPPEGRELLNRSRRVA